MPKQTTEARLRREFARDYGRSAEQFCPTPTLYKWRDSIRVTQTLLNGKQRLRDPETGGCLKMSGDVARFGPILETCILAIWWEGQWISLPSTDALMEWTIDSVCPTPDGRILEPDHPDSWLSLLGLV